MVHKLVKIFLTTLITLVVLLVTAAIAFHYISFNHYRTYFSNYFEQKTGHQLQIQGDLHIELFPFPRFEADQVIIKLDLMNDQYKILSDKILFTTSYATILGKEFKLNNVSFKKLKIINEANDEFKHKLKKLKFSLNVESNILYFTNIKAKHHSGVYEGSIKVDKSDALMLDVSLNSNLITVDSQIREAEQKDSHDPSQLALLKDITANLNLSAKEIIIGEMAFENVNIKSTIEDNQLILYKKSQFINADSELGLLVDNISQESPMANLNWVLKDVSSNSLLHTFDQEFNLPDSNMTLTFLGHAPFHSGRFFEDLEGEVNINIPEIKALELPVASANLSLNDIKNLSADIIFKKNLAPIFKVALESSSTYIVTKESASGAINGLKSFEFDFDAPIEGSMNLKTKTLKLNDLKMQNASIELSFRDDILKIEQTSTWQNGLTNLNMQIFKWNSQNPNLKVNLKLKNVKANIILEKLIEDIEVKGGSVNLELDGTTNIKNLKQNFEGVLKLTAHKIDKSLLKQGSRNQAISQFAFDYISTMSAHIQYRKNTQTITNIDINSHLLNIQTNMTNSNQLFSKQAIDYTFLAKVNGKLNINAGRFIYNNTHMQNLNLTITNQANRCTIKKNANWLDGRSRLTLEISNITNKTPNIAVDYKLFDANATKMIHLIDAEPRIRDGRVSVDINGRGQANTIKELFSTFTGNALIQMHQITIVGRTTKPVSTMIGALFNSFSFNENKSHDTINCFVSRFGIKNGIAQANKSIGIETNALLGLGSGNVNFRNETLNFDFDFYPKRNLSFRIMNFHNRVSVQGKIQNPKVNVNAVGIAAKKVGNIFIAIATGGLSVVAKELMGMSNSGLSPCTKVLNDN